MHADFHDLELLCADRQLNSPEQHSPNDFYGHAQCIKAYCGLPRTYAIKAAMEHGAGFVDRYWDADLDAPLPAILVMSEVRAQFLARFTSKAIHVLGPYIHYAPSLLGPEETARERKRLGPTLLAFPAHSSHNLTFEYNLDGFCRALERIGRDFQSIRVCIYWKDALLGRAEEYRRRGFEVVTCGHIFDPLFLPRLRTLLETSSLTASNFLTTAIGYSVYLGVPHLLVRSILSVSAPTKEIFENEFSTLHDKRVPARCIEVEEAFATFDGRITARQAALAARHWGFDMVRSPSEMRRLLEVLEEEYKLHNVAA